MIFQTYRCNNVLQYVFVSTPIPNPSSPSSETKLTTSLAFLTVSEEPKTRHLPFFSFDLVDLLRRKSTHLSLLSLLNKLRIPRLSSQNLFAITHACSSSLLRSRSIYSRLIMTRAVVILPYFYESIISQSRDRETRD